MQWNSQAIILNQQKFSDEKIICTVFSRDYGVYKGLISINGKTRTLFQVGNLVDATWKARLPEHLGVFYCELIKPLPMIILNDRFKLTSVTSLTSIISAFLPEKVKEEVLYECLFSYLLCLKDHNDWLIDYIWYELNLLKELGYGLDLTSCVVTGVKEDLVYVSPKSGRAVSSDAGKHYHDKLLRLPGFFLKQKNYDRDEILAGLKLTRYFINKYLCHTPSPVIPEVRLRFEDLISNSFQVI